MLPAVDGGGDGLQVVDGAVPVGGKTLREAEEERE